MLSLYFQKKILSVYENGHTIKGIHRITGHSRNTVRKVIRNKKPSIRYEVFRMLKAEGKITDAVIENMLSWRHSGFNVYCGPAIWPHDEDALENLAHYIIRAAFSQERMTYIAEHESSDGIVKVTYQSKDGKTSKTFDGLDWLAQLTTHIPDKNEMI